MRNIEVPAELFLYTKFLIYNNNNIYRRTFELVSFCDWFKIVFSFLRILRCRNMKSAVVFESGDKNDITNMRSIVLIVILMSKSTVEKI